MIPIKPPRKVVVSAAIAPDDLEALDAAGRTMNASRSELIATAVKRFIDQLDEGL